jgi:hypothetical protein
MFSFLWNLFRRSPKITVYINNFNLLEWTKALHQNILQLDNLAELYIIDNNSDYQPLLEWYETQDNIIRLDRNVGHKAPWSENIVQTCKTDWYVVTDPDLDISGVPGDVFSKLIWGINKFNTYKAGLSLEIQNLPDNPLTREFVLAWESKYWEKKVDGFYMSPVDTTFALYRKKALKQYCIGEIDGIRSDRPYTAKHLPFYISKENAPEDFINYLRTCNNSASGSYLYKRILGI